MIDFIVLNDARKLIKAVYLISFPINERFILESQLKRAVISVALNLREGNTFHGQKKLNFFNIALGSLQETDECLILLNSLYLIDIQNIRDSLEILRRKITSLRSSLLAPRSP